MRSMIKKVQIKPSVAPEIANLLNQEADRRKKSYGVIVNEALAQYFDPDSVKTRESILLKRIDQMERRIINLSDNLVVLTESFSVFVQTYLSRLSDIPKEEEACVASRTHSLFKDFLSQVEKACRDGSSLLVDMPREGGMSESEAKGILNEFFKDK